MSLTLKAAALLFAAVSATGVTTTTTADKAAKCDGASRPASCAKADDCDPAKCPPEECEKRCPEAAKASCEKPQASAKTALTCARR